MSPHTVQFSTGSPFQSRLFKDKTGTRTSDRRIDLEHIGLLSQQLSSPLQYPQRLFLSQSALSIEVILQECNVRFCAILPAISEKLFRCGLEHGWRLNL